MRVTFFLTALTALASWVTASPKKGGAQGNVHVSYPIPLDVVLKRVREGGFEFEATIFNHNVESIKVLNYATFLHKWAPIKRAEIFARGKRVAFLGIVPKMDYTRLKRKHFTTIPSGKTISVKFDVAENYDLTAGGEHTIQLLGSLPFAQIKGRHIAGFIPYQSNKLQFMVNGEAAEGVRAKYLRERRRIRRENCSGGRVPRMRESLSHCVQLSLAAQEAALNGPAWRMEEAFGFSDGPIRQHVAKIFSDTADKCRTDSTRIQEFCREYYRDCVSNDRILMAYLREPSLQIGYCDPFFDLPILPKRCYVYDRPDAWGWFPSRASTVIQKTVHANLRKSGLPGNMSLDAEPGLPKILALDRNSSLQSPDNYELFATHLKLGCIAVSPAETNPLAGIPLFGPVNN
ncbi:Deuterolysin metalloprotease family-domain-containing protein [Fusarium solani]|uniref:deuterolysin n=1 Tax=Fusarium solani TaxID=169388 RepID=A0A9P9HB81_FUSSL|nr:Deuterolysin metalloprotease family-domain-containing protein [Fusarium solani]KAH7254455.1 Deuterolysin metalloprotease family-domain-containing protein [Fusarium solani]